MNVVQVLNPKTGKYVLVDRDEGLILDHRPDLGPYLDVPVAKYKTIKEARFFRKSGREFETVAKEMNELSERLEKLEEPSQQ